ncbi:uncharacterized protein [Cherax quadricarinatus]|uniref:uncharacterized protein isoform X5 n=1 Tax=Cherax quadricarinatus TaxID=27406 RepID=UPI00387EE0E2
MGSSGHEEGTLRVFWAWVEGATGNIALALEGLVEQVRSWATLGGLGASYIMDTLNTLLVGWMIFVALILIIGTFFYYKFINHFESSDFGRPQDTQPQGELQEKKQVKETRAASGKSGPAAPPVPPAKKPTIVPDRAEEPVSPPVATGADPDAVRWTNNVFTWLYNSVDGAPAIKKTWLHTINENTVKTALETGILVEVVEIYKTSPAPALYNMVVDCSPTDSMTITCDCDATIYLRLGTTRTQGDKTTESEYACAVRPLRGRLNIAAVAPELTAVVKFDGWPEVSLKLEGIRNNAVGLDEQQMLDVIDEVLTSALRNSVLDVSFQTNKTFPRFRRARQVPDPIIPVGYDSMVRELQTHPPSAPRKQKKKNRLGSVHDEEIEEAGESFTALTFSSNLSKQINLTTSEEQLIARNLHKYPSLENSDMGDDISEFYKSWEENYVPATGVAHVDVQKVKAPVTVSQTNPKEDTKTQNFVLVASNRSKLIDEPRTADCVQEIEEEEEPELVPHLKQNVEDEPCIRRRSRSPLLLGKPKLEEPEESLELEEGENLNTLQLHKTDLVDKSLTGTSGFGPLPSLPGLQKGPFVSALSSTTTGQSTGIPGLNGKRLLVKIVKATGVGCENLVSEAYAVVEMDEPPQKFTTSIMKDTSSPFWDEQFLFDLSGSTLELLFEVYDKKNGKFLGLGIVGIEELVATPSQRQIIPLQSRPYENDEVSGSLTVEFLFLDRADLPEHTLRSSATSQSITPKGDLITTTTTTYVKAPESPVVAGAGDSSPGTYRRRESYRKANNIRSDVIVNGGDGVAAAVLRDIEGKKDVVVNNASKSTMIIHASRKVQRAPSGEYKELTVQPDEEYLPALPVQDLTALTTTATTTTPTITTTPTHDIGTTTSLMPTTPTTTISTSTNTTNVDGTEPNETDERGRSRGSHRKRDSFFGTLKKRFSRSKVRSKSVDPSARDTSMDRDASVGRSLSAERSANLSRASDEQQVNPPSLRDTIAPRLLSVPANISGDGGSTRSSLSDASAISSSSTRTYVNEASTLIIETSENGVFKHYLIPLALQQKSKWRKKGLKLHIFGEHTFVAKHMSSSTPCEVCHKTLGRRFGKQGYVCRDCGFKCHKPCHVKTETVCPNSTINTMDLLDDLVCGEEEVGASTKKCYKSSKNLYSSYSFSTTLPTIQEKLPLDDSENVSSNSDPNHNLQISLENGGHCQCPGLDEDSQRVRCLPKVQRTVSFSFSRVCPKLNSCGAKLGLSSHMTVIPDMVELLPAINVEPYDKAQQR